MIVEIERFLDDLSAALGIKRQALCLIVDHLGYSVKYHDVRYHMKSLDVQEAESDVGAGGESIPSIFAGAVD